MKKWNKVRMFVVLCLTAAVTSFAASISGISPSLGISGQSVDISVIGEDTGFTSVNVLDVRLVKGQLSLTAESFEVISSTIINAMFNLSNPAQPGIWTVAVETESETLFLEDAFTAYFYPDLNDDGIVDINDFALFSRHFLQIAPGFIIITDITGQTQAQAEQAIISQGLTIGQVSQEYSDTVAAGLVISQNPAAGEIIELAAAVSLIVSKGSQSEPDITWITINDAGVSGHEGFNGQMSKYETTNAQYCQFLNAALLSGDIVFNTQYNYAEGANGSNSGEDFVGQNYYYVGGTGFTYNGATDGGMARISYSNGEFAVVSGFENHPVTFVSWYGATAFCNYYQWRLPTEWEWQAVADYDGSYTYGCGSSISNAIANFFNSAHTNGTTEVGTFGSFGYDMADMAGNVWELTSSTWTAEMTNAPVLRGGHWYGYSSQCPVSYRYNATKTFQSVNIGFRVCR